MDHRYVHVLGNQSHDDPVEVKKKMGGARLPKKERSTVGWGGDPRTIGTPLKDRVLPMYEERFRRTIATECTILQNGTVSYTLSTIVYCISAGCLV